MNANIITLSYPTVGPSGAYEPAATYNFMTRDYKPPSQRRAVGYDVVHNQSGKFKYVYDNGPSFYTWQPFQLVLDDSFASLVGASATTQWNNFLDVWQHQETFTLQTPDGVYDVHWSDSELDREFARFPSEVGDKIEYRVTVQFEEAS